ncbi:MAG: hypothetical protein CSA75_04705, partial [Sorangium cellulosum]
MCLVQAWMLVLVLFAYPAHGQTSASGASLHLSPPSELGGLLGRPIRAVQVVQRGQWRSKASVTSIQLGERLTATAARRAANELLSTGGFADVVATAEAMGEGVRLRLEAVPRRLIAMRRLSGSAFRADEIWREMGLWADDELTEERLAQLADRIRAFHHARGYPNARVRTETRDTDDPAKVVLIVHVDAGPALEITDRVFVIPQVSQQALREVVEDYEAGEGDRLDETLLESADAKLEEVLKARRYPEARVQHKAILRQGRAFLYVYVHPGTHIRYRFEGNERFDRDQLAEVIDYDKASELAPEALAHKLRDFYQSVGMLDATVQAQRRGQPN